MFLRLRFPYRAPRLLLHCLHAATRFVNALMPGVLSGHLSTSSRWSAVVASRVPHQWQGGLSASSARLFRLNSAVFRARDCLV